MTAQPAAGPERPVAVADLGSNSFRLVVYRPPPRAPVILYNERVIVGLAGALGTKGTLPKHARREALSAVVRFHELARAMHARDLRMVATAAIRDAADGAALIRDIRERTGTVVEVMDGRREAQLAAKGLMAGTPDADGILADMGGGSIEFARVCGGETLADASLPAGMLRLIQASRRDPEAAEQCLARDVRRLAWLQDGRGRPFYAIGGSWRALARTLQHRTRHPLPVIHGYWLRQAELADHLAELVTLPVRKLPRTVPRHRRASVPFAAAALLAVVRTIRPSMVVFSGYGLREGILLDQLEVESGPDSPPLLDACASLEPLDRPFVGPPDTVAGWVAPALNAGDTAIADRDFLRACARLSDLAWNQHPEHRASYAFDRVALRPLLPVSQTVRIRLALALYSRYTAAAVTGRMRAIAELISGPKARSARSAGLALRLAMTIGGGTAQPLEDCKLELQDGVLALHLPRQLDAEIVQARLRMLADALGREHRVIRL